MLKFIWNTSTGLALLMFFAMLVSAGCATIPCEPMTCTAEQLDRDGKDPFGQEPISFGSIFGPQPEPGKVTVEP